MVAFEVAGLLLTAALVGAIAIAHREEDVEPANSRRGRSTVAGNRRLAGMGLVAGNGPGSRLSLTWPWQPALTGESNEWRELSDDTNSAELVSLFCRRLVLDRAGGVLVRRNAIAVLMAIEIMLNAANVNLVAFWRYGPERPEAGPIGGVMLAIMVLTVAASEVAVGIGLILLCYRRWHAADVDRYDSLEGSDGRLRASSGRSDRSHLASHIDASESNFQSYDVFFLAPRSC